MHSMQTLQWEGYKVNSEQRQGENKSKLCLRSPDGGGDEPKLKESQVKDLRLAGTSKENMPSCLVCAQHAGASPGSTAAMSIKGAMSEKNSKKMSSVIGNPSHCSNSSNPKAMTTVFLTSSVVLLSQAPRVT